MLRSPISGFIAGLALTALLPSGARALIVADSADDICSPVADPCQITEVIEIVPGSVLDFGLRAVEISNGGQLDFGSGSSTVLCGSISATVGSNTAIKLRDVDTGGFATISAFRACSGDPGLRCLTDSTCIFQNKGTCSTGPTGTVSLDGKIGGSGILAGSLDLRAAGDIVIDRPLAVDGESVDSDGGFVEIESFQGGITINGKISATGGIFSTGGDVTLFAATDVHINDIIDVSGSGGDSDGGTVEIDALGTVTISDEIIDNSGAGIGGGIFVTAVGDIVFDGGTSGNNMRLATNAQTDVEQFSGDGGEQEYVADGDILVGRFAKFLGNGSAPDGDGADAIIFEAAGDIVFEGKAEARGLGTDGAGGEIDFDAGGDLILTSTSKLDVSGGSGGAGFIELLSSGLIQFDGNLDATSGTGGGGAVVAIDATGAVSIGGELDLNGTGDVLDIDGCTVTIEGSGDIDNRGDSSETTLVGRQVLGVVPITIESGAKVITDGVGGVNRFTYIDALVPPAVSGNVNPVALDDVQPFLVRCPGCSNSQLDFGETCDDGNLVNGDGCSMDCQLESCIAQSIDYPAQPLCNDDSACTVDQCDTLTGNCVHVLNCNDGIGCTVDQCVAGQCVHTPDDLACSDGDLCTDDLCTTTVGCIFPFNIATCDDGLFCNGPDTCSAGLCTPGSSDPCVTADCAAGCDEMSDSCLPAPGGTLCTDDGNPCTDDICDAFGNCTHPPNSAPCEDGIACTVGDQCGGGSCQPGTPDDSFCIDGDICTDDVCAIGVGCTNPFNTAPCDDGDMCTVADACASGVCTGGPSCGDGTVQAGCGEECDPPDGVTCDASCIAIVCGNGIIQPGEQCDDFNAVDGDCCDSSCQLDAPGAACGDSDVCNGVETCDGAGTCVPGTPLNCDDGDLCTQDICDPVAGCSNTDEPTQTCFDAGKAVFQVKDKEDDGKDRLTWKWLRGDATFLSDFGSPGVSTQYELCVYDASAGSAPLSTRVAVPPSASWQPVSFKGFKYKDKLLTSDGAQTILVKTGAPGKSKATLKAKGVNLPTPVPVGGGKFFNADPSVTVQLHNSSGTCWTSEFPLAKKNEIDQYKAKTP